MGRPALSVLIDTHNHERYIEQAVVSAIEQDFPASEYEIVVVDDGSTDRTPDIVRKFEPRVRLLRKKNGGQASAFNAAFPELNGEIVAFLDGDDWFAPGKLSAAMDALERHPEAVAVGHGFHKVDDSTGQSTACVPQAKLVQLLEGPTYESQGAWPFLGMGALTMRRGLLGSVLPIPEALVFCADFPISNAALARGVFLIDKPLFHYRHHADNLYASAGTDAVKAQRRARMTELTCEAALNCLLRLGIPRDRATSLLYPFWVETSRTRLSSFGGSRLDTLQTETRAFEAYDRQANLARQVLRYLLIGPATLALPPQWFYKAKHWWKQKGTPVGEAVGPQ